LLGPLAKTHSEARGEIAWGWVVLINLTTTPCIVLHVHPPPQHKVPGVPARQPSDGLVAAPRGNLCRMLDMAFRENPFPDVGE